VDYEERAGVGGEDGATQKTPDVSLERPTPEDKLEAIHQHFDR
jgi:hypothetical protein